MSDITLEEYEFYQDAFCIGCLVAGGEKPVFMPDNNQILLTPADLRKIADLMVEDLANKPLKSTMVRHFQ